MNRPTVTVVIPTFNSQQTIRAALESVFAQSVPPDEVIVVDDESVDNTTSIVTSNFENVRVIEKKNGGPSSARNMGISNAHCEWIAFLDADDIWAKDKLEIQLDEISRNPKAVVVASNWSPDAHLVLRKEKNRDLTTIASQKYWTSQILVLNRFQTSTVLARRAQLQELGRFRGRTGRSRRLGYVAAAIPSGRGSPD